MQNNFFFQISASFRVEIVSAVVEGNEAMAKFKEPIQKYIIVPKRNKKVLKIAVQTGGVI